MKYEEKTLDLIIEKTQNIKEQIEIIEKAEKTIEKELRKKGYTIKIIKGYSYVYKNKYDKKTKSTETEYIGPTIKIIEHIRKRKEKKIEKLLKELEQLKKRKKEIINNYEEEIKELIESLKNIEE
jgi:replication-associated recombination protein RarA